MTGSTFKVDFFCVGVAKAGTTTLHDLLTLQGRISLPKRKETNYFSFGLSGKPAFTGPLDNSSVNERTITSLEEYIDDFEHEPGCLIGEVCPSYALDGVATNIYQHNPDAKIIVLLREPVARAYSNYQHLVRDGREYASFEQALACEADRLSQGWEWFWGLKSNSLYYDFVKQYVDTFGRENVRIFLFEEFVKNQEQHIKDILEFIGLDPAMARHENLSSNKSGVVSGKWRHVHRALLSEGKLNSTLRVVLPSALRKKLGSLFKTFSTVKGEVSAETGAHLSDIFSSDLRQLDELIGGRVGNWLEHRQRNVS